MARENFVFDPGEHHSISLPKVIEPWKVDFQNHSYQMPCDLCLFPSKKKVRTISIFDPEHGSFTDNSPATFSLTDEDHTIANVVRFTLNQDPRVTFCGYSIPHPLEARVNIIVQTTGDPAREVLKDACQNLMLMCRHVRCTFDKAVEDFKASNVVKAMKIDSQDSSGDDSEESE
ncbi:hypothetical protein V6Z11_A06G126800 [Gossypium hirsutum]